MADNAQLKAAITNVIKTNGTQAITGQVLQNALLTMINSLGANYQFVGIAATNTNPGTPDQNVFYLAGEGTYINFSNLTIDVGELGVLKWNGTWSKQVLEIGSGGGNMILDWNTDAETTRKQVQTKFRKPGLQITYKKNNTEWITEQYIGTLITDVYWQDSQYWEESVKQQQITDLQDQTENSIENIRNGETITYEEINLGQITDGTTIKNGVDFVFSGRASTSFIDVEQYQGNVLAVLYIAQYPDSDAYAFYDEYQKVISYTQGRGLQQYTKILIPYGIKYMRIACSSANINNLKMVREYQEIPGINNISNIEKTLSLIQTDKKFVVNYVTEAGGGISVGFGIEIPSTKFTRAKIYASTEKAVSFGIITYNEDLGVYIPLKRITIDAKPGTNFYDIDLNLLGYGKSYVIFVSGINYAKGLAQYGGVKLYRIGNYGIVINEEDIQLYSSVNYNFSIDLEYEEALGTSEEEPESMILGSFFKGKEYVAYGDSITVTPSANECYPILLAKYFLGLTLINKGQSGTIPYGIGANANLTDANLEAVTENTMLVTISGGQNRWIHDDDINSLDRTTSIGSINYYIDKIREISPTCIIILCPTYIGNGDSQCAIDYKAISENKHVGLAPTLDLTLIDWEFDKTVQKLRYDNMHPTAFGAARFAAVCREYIRQFVM